MKLKDLGEFGLIQKIAEQFSRELPSNVEGIGDDCAMIAQSPEETLLVTTDLLVENIHFLREDISAFELGHKSLAVNVSDIAAMGGTPQYAFLSIALPSDLEGGWLKDFFDGFYALAKEHGVLLMGGDTTKSKQGVVINVALLGKAHPAKIKRRSQAKIGDFICVTDSLGDSGAGLEVILKKYERTELEKKLVSRHYLPRPHVAEGQFLAKESSVHAMMDVSDGIDSDLKRIMECSSCGVHVDLDQLPLSKEIQTFSQKYKLNPVEIAASAGEDYCLLFTVDPKSYEQVLKSYSECFQKPFYKIGKITEDKKFIYFNHHQETKLSLQGFDHFKKGNSHESKN